MKTKLRHRIIYKLVAPIMTKFLKKKFNSTNASFTQLNRGILDEETLRVAQMPFALGASY